MSKITPLALAVISATPLLAQAQVETTNSQLEEVVVVSSRVAMPLRQIGTSVSVITAADIEARGYNSLFDVLRTQPAIGVSNTGGAGSATSVRVRGEEGYRTKLYIDGIDVSDSSGTQIGPKFENLMSAGINRVEILRGTQGMMYGADAGGVINAYTRAAEPGFSGRVSAEGGRYGTQQLAADAAGGNDTLDFSISAIDFETDGFNTQATDTDLRDDDGYENTTLHGRLGWNISDDLRVEAVLRDTEGENEYDSCFSSATFTSSNDCYNTFDQSAWHLSAELQTGRFSHDLSYTGNETERKFYTEDVFGFGGDGDLDQYGYLGSFTVSDATRLVYGAERKEESFDDGFNNRERNQDGYYLEYQGEVIDDFFVTAGARYDDNDDFGSHTTYRASGAYLIPMNNGELKLKATYGTGFRAPSLYEVAYNSSVAASPPASEVVLKEEESEGFDVGIAWYANSGVYLEANYFDQTVSDEIFFDPTGFSGYLQGDGDFDSSGVELIGTLPLPLGLTLDGNYTYNDTERAAGGSRARRPEHLANLGLTWLGLADRLSVALYVRGSYDAVDVDGSDLDDYELVNLNASFEIIEGLELYGRVENLLDEDYQEVPTYNTSGSAAYAGVRYNF
ncbi:TonB-dependent receptor [Halioglobus japonicus]|uniref:TonB-dependent receptor n=1 Tax=Halioglobus japonicus TaxID=930805 RepID=A0AAP8MH91_9GAMM|nr:TonB-dependent receptor [Halioglobus japonicus]AQA19186.1 TonB-dependent receptor [Halioglobus japonicus]PLW87778.1 TonB-dependent receptor [Halioglobus japonicus]GHD06616.1 TonB-dependent receptor [Halioglobus japonicus]